MLSGRGMLPTCVVRIRFVLIFIRLPSTFVCSSLRRAPHCHGAAWTTSSAGSIVLMPSVLRHVPHVPPGGPTLSCGVCLAPEYVQRHSTGAGCGAAGTRNLTSGHGSGAAAPKSAIAPKDKGQVLLISGPVGVFWQLHFLLDRIPALTLALGSYSHLVRSGTVSAQKRRS